MSLAGHKRDLAMCAFCPKMCRFACPVAEAEHREAVTPAWKMIQTECLRSGVGPDTPQAAEVVNHCLACLHCRTYCRHGVDVPGALLAARAQLLLLRRQHGSVSEILRRFREYRNPLGEDLAQNLARFVPQELQVPEAQVVLFAGCQALRSESLIAAAVKVLAALGVDVVGVFAGDDLCCGAPLWHLGDRRQFATHAARLRRQLGGARRVLCLCPTCEETLQNLYPEAGQALGAKVQDLAEWLEPRLTPDVPIHKLDGSFTYHDPCYAARYRNRTEPPRRLLARILAEPLRETAGSREDTVCCGGGGGLPWILPETGAAAARRRLTQLLSTGAERIATSCPGCRRMLGEAGGKALDVIELLAEALVGSSDPTSVEKP